MPKPPDTADVLHQDDDAAGQALDAPQAHPLEATVPLALVVDEVDKLCVQLLGEIDGEAAVVDSPRPIELFLAALEAHGPALTRFETTRQWTGMQVRLEFM